MLFERLDVVPTVLKELWAEAFPTMLLEELATSFGISFVES